MKRFEHVINSAVREVMSDVHITGGHPMVSRKDGVLQFHPDLIWTHQEIDDLVRKLLTPRQLDELRQRKSSDFAVSVSHARLRINVFATARGLSLAIRVLPGRIPTIEEINLHPCMHEIAGIKSGLVLSCGPTGVGKTTTIAAIINDINTTRNAHVITLENPIEFRFNSDKSFIQQRELGVHIPTFEQGLLDVLRENPDVIVVGELREPETMRLTLNAAESGHLVIATMHASTPEETIYRLCNSVPPEAQNEVRYQLASSLKLVVVQQLVYLERIGFSVPLLTIVRGTSSIKNLIRENKLNQLNSAIQMSKGEGMFTAERYLEEYLENRTNFAPYNKTFRPSRESTKDPFYLSPLTGNAPQLAKNPKAGTASQPTVIRSEQSGEDVDNMLSIEDDISLQEVIAKLK